MDPLPTYRHPRRLLACGAAAGLAANAWFVDGPLGIGVFVFALGWVAALRFLGGKESWQRAGSVKWLLLPMLVCAAFVGVRSAPTLTALNLLAATWLGALCVQAFAGDRPLWGLGLRGYLGAGLEGLMRPLLAGPVVVSESVDRATVGGAFRQYGKPAMRATAVAMPILAVFAALLASADEVFATLISGRLDALVDGDLGDLVSGVCVVGGVTLAAAGSWAIALRRREAPTPDSGPVLNAERAQARGAFEAFAIVGSLILLFGGFGLIQAACLFGNVPLPASLTWAEYARQGFFQLLVVAGLTVGLLTVLSRAVRMPAHLTAPFSAACGLLVALTLLILASAVKRLTLYEEAYGFTELRVYSHVFAFALGAMLLWRAVTMWKLTQTFATGALVTMVGFVLALNVLNPDAFIAEKNLARHGETVGLDVDYLARLSTDAYPVLKDQKIDFQLPEKGGWASFNFSRDRVRGR